MCPVARSTARLNRSSRCRDSVSKAGLLYAQFRSRPAKALINESWLLSSPSKLVPFGEQYWAFTGLFAIADKVIGSRCVIRSYAHPHALSTDSYRLLTSLY